MTDEYIHTGRTNKQCEPLRGEILAALLEAGDYDDLYRRCMEAIDNPDKSRVETITWIPVQERLPDDETTVLLSVRQDDGSPYTGEAFIDEDGLWHWQCCSRVTQGVIAWAEMPRGMG